VLPTELYLALHDHVRDIIIVIDRETGVILDANRAAELAYGYARDELCAMTIFDLRQLDPQSSVEQQMTVADHDGVLFEAMHRRKDGTAFPVEVSSRGETVDTRRLLLSIIRDITDRKRLDAERDQLLRTTQAALATRDEFLAVASHELRTPVAIADLQLQHALRSLERDDPRARVVDIVERARSQIHRLDALVGRLLDASRIGAGIDVEYADADLADIVRDAVERIRARTDLAGTELLVHVPAILGRWDPLRLEQVLTNLLTNAVKYGEGRPVSIDARADGANVLLDVRDRGIGMDADVVDRIFEKFERAVPSAHYGGLGLGLYIAKQIVTAHGGTIAVTSAPRVGTTFHLTLPLAPAR
jgi:PAS domain S-box-containing protein